MSDKYLVWSNEHRCWWRPDSRGHETGIAAIIAKHSPLASPPFPELREALEKIAASLTKSSLTNHERIEDALLVARAALSGGKNG